VEEKCNLFGVQIRVHITLPCGGKFTLPRTLTQHPNYKYTADFDKKYTFDIEKYLKHRAKLRLEDVFEVIDVG